MNILSFDVSTSNTGACVFDTVNYKILNLIHAAPPSAKNLKSETDLELLIEKADNMLDTFHTVLSKYDIHHIVVEEPLQNSMSQKVARTLELFNNYFSVKAAKRFKTTVSHISVDNARRIALPELLWIEQKGKTTKSTLFGNFPKDFDGIPFKDLRKLCVLYCISQRFPTLLKWELNQNNILSDSNYDAADSIVVGLAYAIQQGLTIAEKPPRENAINFLLKYAKYLNFNKEQQKILGKNSSEFKEITLQTLKETFTASHEKIFRF